MKKEKIMDAMEHVDDEILHEAEIYRQKKRRKKTATWKKLVAFAACVCLIVSAIVIVPRLNINTGGAGNAGTNSLFVKPSSFLIASAVYPKTVDYDENDDALFDAWYDARIEKRELARKYNGTGEEFFKKSVTEFLKNDGENAVYSPLNVYFALSILAETTDENSRKQILSLLGEDDIESVRKTARDLWNIEYTDDATGKSVFANSLWLRDGVQFNKSTLQTIADNYYASSYSGDMSDEKFNQARRNWVNEQTDNILSDAADNLEFSADCIMSLVSTVNFRAKWTDEFSKDNTYDEIFHATDKDTKCEFMHKTEYMTSYYWGDNFSAVPLGLMENGTMWFILPDEGVSPETLLADVQVQQMLSSRNEYKNSSYPMVDLSVPKFDISGNLDITDTLENLGVTDIFDFGKSDFSPLTDGDIAVTSAEHAARVTIDEEGVTAAAFTSFDYSGAGLPTEKVDFKLDRPFMFVIMGKGSIPLFVGIVNRV